MSENGAIIPEILAQNRDITASYGKISLDSSAATRVEITTRKAFAHQMNAENNPEVGLPDAPFVSAKPTDHGSHVLHFETPDIPQIGPNKYKPENGRVLVLTPRKSGRYEVRLAQDGQKVNFRQGMLVVTLSGDNVDGAKIDQLLQNKHPRIASLHADADGVLEDLVKALSQHSAAFSEVHFGLLADSSHQLQTLPKPLPLVPEYFQARRRAERSWEPKSFPETLAQIAAKFTLHRKKQKAEGPYDTIAPNKRVALAEDRPLSPAEQIAQGILHQLDEQAQGNYLNQVPAEYQSYVENLANENWHHIDYQARFGNLEAFKQVMAKNWEAKRRTFIALAHAQGFEPVQSTNTPEDLNSQTLIALTSSGSEVILGPGAYGVNDEQGFHALKGLGASFRYEKIPLRHGEHAPHNQNHSHGRFLLPDRLPQAGKPLAIIRKGHHGLSRFFTSPLLLVYKHAGTDNSSGKPISMDDFHQSVMASSAVINNNAWV